MIEKSIYLEEIDPLNFYGVNDSKLNILKKHFPKIKIIGRGNEIKIIGEENEINRLEEKIRQLLVHYNNYNTISENDTEKIVSDMETDFPVTSENGNVLLYGNHGKTIKARSYNQQLLVDLYTHNDLLFAIGPAGSGKTYTAIALAVRALKNKEVKKIVLSRPAVEAGERLGFLPGDMKDKLDPYLQPLYDALADMIPPKKLEGLIEERIIEIAPLAYMRGRTLENAFAILDEAQNTTINQLKMFLTRMGKFSKFVVTGDLTQIDLPDKKNSGLIHAAKILKDIADIAIIYFDGQDIIRHKLVRNIVAAYEKENQKTVSDNF
ncbi:MAG: PhoH family protein [Bacteroidia bacterium]|nr:PhoH family protein [Bacteroidia bacterium]